MTKETVTCLDCLKVFPHGEIYRHLETSGHKAFSRDPNKRPPGERLTALQRYRRSRPRRR